MFRVDLKPFTWMEYLPSCCETIKLAPETASSINSTFQLKYNIFYKQYGKKFCFFIQHQQGSWQLKEMADCNGCFRKCGRAILTVFRNLRGGGVKPTWCTIKITLELNESSRPTHIHVRTQYSLDPGHPPAPPPYSKLLANLFQIFTFLEFLGQIIMFGQPFCFRK